MPDINVPDNWITTQLLSLIPPRGMINDGDWIETKDQDTNGNIRLIQLADIGDGYFKDKSERFINEETFSRLSCTELIEGDLLIARLPDPLGRTCIFPKISKRAITVVDICIIRSGGVVNPSWLMYWINSPEFRRSISLNASGTTRKRIARKKLEGFELPLPPLAEQKQIAARLDALLAQVDTLKTRLESIPTILKRFRQSVLAAAVSGKLTEQWRGKNKFEDVGEEIKKIQDVRNNEGAVGKKRKPDFSFHNLEKPHRNIPREWKLVQLGEVINELTDYHANGSYEVLKQHVELKEKEDFACMIRATNFEKNNFNDLLIYITKDAYNFLEKSKLFGGEVLMCKIGNAGSVYYMPNLNRPASLAMNLFAIRFNNELVNSKYIYFYLKSQFGENDIQKYVRGVATKSIDKQSVRSIFVNLPSFNEQTEIVRRVDQLFAFADQIEQRVAEAKKRVDHLTQSILAKAFRGDLTSEWRAQNPDMISGENSAEALLARIKAERAGVQASGKASKRRSEA